MNVRKYGAADAYVPNNRTDKRWQKQSVAKCKQMPTKCKQLENVKRKEREYEQL